MALIHRINRKMHMICPPKLAELMTNLVVKKEVYPVVIMFHHVQPESEKEDSPYTITPEKFEEIIKYYVDQKYEFCFENEFYKAKGKRVIVSFDDGNTNNYEYAYPILKKYNAKASINIISRKINTDVDNPYLSIDKINEMKASGLIQFQSHTCTHASLPDCDKGGYEMEVCESQKEILEQLGINTDVFVYPCGRTNAEISKYTSKYYKFAYGGYDDDIDFNYRLPREELFMSDNPKTLARRTLYNLRYRNK